MENGTSATRVVLYIVLASAISALATVGLCVGVLYGAYGALLSPTGAAKLSAIVSNMNVTDGAITGLLIGDMDTPHNLLLGAGRTRRTYRRVDQVRHGGIPRAVVRGRRQCNVALAGDAHHVTHDDEQGAHVARLFGWGFIHRTDVGERELREPPPARGGIYSPPVFRRSVYSNSPFRRTINITIFPNGQRQLGPSRPTVR